MRPNDCHMAGEQFGRKGREIILIHPAVKSCGMSASMPGQSGAKVASWSRSTFACGMIPMGIPEGELVVPEELRRYNAAP